MFLSKVMVSSRRNRVATLLKVGENRAYASHQWLWQLFSQSQKSLAASEKTRPFIFREEMTAQGLPYFYVLSHYAPDDSHPDFSVKTKPFQPKFYQGQRLAYKLRANPTITITDNHRRTKRHDVLMHAKQQAKKHQKTPSDINIIMQQSAQAWLGNEQRVARWGVELPHLPDIEAYTQHHGVKKNGHCVQFSSVDFQGVLTVMQPDVFNQQYRQGFGRAKAFGCGLMMVRPI